jgi:hypothetical protein
MRCSSDVLKKTSPLDVFGDVSEKVKHLTNDASNDVSRPALSRSSYSRDQRDSRFSRILENFFSFSLLVLDLEPFQFHFHFSKKSEGILFFTFHFSKKVKAIHISLFFLEKKE